MKLITAEEFIRECWCRNLRYTDLLYYAEKYYVTPKPTMLEYEEYCLEEDEKMDKFFRDELPQQPEEYL